MVPYYRITSKCWDNGIFVVQCPTNVGYVNGGHPVKLNLEINGKIVKFGKIEYKQNSEELIDKIEEIYRSMYDRIT